jgi:hypothetical protein
MFSKTVVGGGCVVAGTKIIMADGNTKNIEEVQVGEMVKTRLGDNEVTHTWNKDSEGFEGKDRECVEIEFDDGHKVTCTTNHKFFYHGEWIEAKNLIVGGFVEKKNNLSLEKYDGILINQGKKDQTLEVRIKTITNVGLKEVYDISVNEEPSYVFSNGVLSHNTGAIYSSDSIFIIGKNQLKESEEITGSKFIITIEKSRFVKERSKLPITVRWESGIAKWSGFEDLAEEWGVITKCRVGRSLGYQYDSIKDGVIQSKATDIDSDDAFWTRVLEETDLKERIEREYKIGKPKKLVLEILEDEEPIE